MRKQRNTQSKTKYEAGRKNTLKKQKTEEI